MCDCTQNVSCPDNRVTLWSGARSAEDCVCGVGLYGPFCSPCPGGFVCAAANITMPTPCPSGTYCPEGSSGSIVCPNRFVCGVTSAGPTACDLGYFCPMGSKQQLPCPAFAVCSEWGFANCSFGGVAPDCIRFCGNGSVLYNNTCAAICPLHLDCGRRDVNGSAPCLDGFEMVQNVCVEGALAGISIPLIVGLAVAGVVVVVAVAYAVVTNFFASPSVVAFASPSVVAQAEFPMQRIKAL